MLEWTQEGVLQKLPYRCIQRFKESVNSRKSVNRKFCDELLLEKVKCILYEKGGQYVSGKIRTGALKRAKGELCLHSAIQEAKEKQCWRGTIYKYTVLKAKSLKYGKFA